MTFSANLPANRDILTDRPGRSFGPRAAHLRKILPKSALSKVTAELAGSRKDAAQRASRKVEGRVEGLGTRIASMNLADTR